MTDRETNDRELIDAVFGEGHIDREKLDESALAELHELEELDRLLSSAGRRQPDISRRQHLWTRIEARLDEQPTGRSVILRWSAALACVATAAIIAIAVLPRNVPKPERIVSVPNTSTPVSDETSAADRLDQLLERSQPLLMAVANRPPGGSLGAERRLATVLATESRAVADGLHRRRERRDRELAVELEAVLLQIANANKANDLVLVRSTLEDRRILLSITLRDMRRNRAADLARRDVHDV